MSILCFQGENRWLSNFWPVQVAYDGAVYPSVEHAYQAAKAPRDARTEFLHCTAGQAKKLGKKFSPLSDDDKLAVMHYLLIQKFNKEPFRSKLLATGDVHIEEGNHWGDVFWGTCNGVGQNYLGRMIMEIRDGLSDV